MTTSSVDSHRHSKHFYSTPFIRQSAQHMHSKDRLLILLNDLNDLELLSIWTKALRCKPDDKDYARGTHAARVRAISMEWRSVHGHTLMNLRRSSHELAWKRILVDVADKLHPGLGWTSYREDDHHTEQEIEQSIRRMYDESIQRMWAKMSPDARERMAQALDQELDAATASMMESSQVIGLRSVTVSSLTIGISAGLLSGAGALAIAQGTTSLIAGGLLGGVMHQIGLWLVIRVFGFWSGAQLAAGGGLAAVGGALLSAPAAAVIAAQAVMAPSYRKSIPATLMLLGFHEARRQIETAGAES